MVTASFLNLSAVIDSLRGFASVHLVCAGTEGEVTAEDVLLAGAIACECETRYQAVADDDQSMLARQLWRSWFPAARNPPLPDPIDLGRRLRETRGGKNLLARGYPQDLDRCAAIDTAGVVPERTELSPTIFELQAK
jgi:2-phosphosulfolactate phosphatase